MLEAIQSLHDDHIFVEPGKVFSYSNPGYALAGALIEVTSGKPYIDYVSERVFAPLGMSRTTYEPTMAMTYPISQGHHAAGGDQLRVVRPFERASLGTAELRYDLQRGRLGQVRNRLHERGDARR